MKMKTHGPKPLGHRKSSSKREVYSNTSLPQEARHFFFVMFIFETETECEQGRDRERGRPRIQSRF